MRSTPSEFSMRMAAFDADQRRDLSFLRMRTMSSAVYAISKVRVVS